MTTLPFRSISVRPRTPRATTARAARTALGALPLALALIAGGAQAQTLRWASQGDMQTADPHS